MKKTILFTTLATSLLLAACNTDEATVQNEAEQTTASVTKSENTTAPAEPQVDTAEPTAETAPAADITTAPAQPEAVTTTPTPAPAPNPEPTAQKSPVATDTQKVIYGGDSQGEYILPKETVSYSYKANGPLTKFLIEELALSTYYNKHSVSADEKTIVLDFKEDILFSTLIQGSAGGYIFKESVIATFFKNIPTLEVLKLRVEGQEAMSDHVSFAGEITRLEAEASYPNL